MLPIGYRVFLFRTFGPKSNHMKIYLITFLLVLTSGSALAQVGMGGGRNRDMMQQQHDEQGRDKGAAPEEQLEKLMVQMTADLELNGLQEAAMRIIYKEQMAKMGVLRTASMTDSEKQEEARIITEKTDKDVKALLDAQQLEKYEKLKEDMRSGKKKKKKDRDKKPEGQEPHE